MSVVYFISGFFHESVTINLVNNIAFFILTILLKSFIPTRSLTPNHYKANHQDNRHDSDDTSASNLQLLQRCVLLLCGRRIIHWYDDIGVWCGVHWHIRRRIRILLRGEERPIEGVGCLSQSHRVIRGVVIAVVAELGEELVQDGLAHHDL